MKKNAILIDINKIKIDRNHFPKFDLLKEMLGKYKQTTTDLNSKEEIILQNVWRSVIKRKSGWSTTKIEIEYVDENFVSTILMERAGIIKEIKELSKNKDQDSQRKMEEKIHLLEANQIINFYNSELWKNDPFELNYLLEMHKHIFVLTKKIDAGRFKKAKNYISVSERSKPSYDVEFVNPSLVKDKLKELLFFVKNSNLDPIFKIIICHAQFVVIHPFIDGNGRSVRVFITKLLQYFENIFLPIDESILNLPLRDAIKHNLDEYKYVLNQVSIYENINEFIEYMIEKYYLQMQENLELLNKIKKHYKQLIIILMTSGINKKYHDAICSLLLSQLIVTTKKAKFYISNIKDIRTIREMLQKLIELKLLVKIDNGGKEKLYKTNLEILDFS